MLRVRRKASNDPMIRLLSAIASLTFASLASAAPLDFRPRCPADPLAALLQVPRPGRQCRKAKLRLDPRAGAMAKGKSGEPIIVPGKPDASELVRAHSRRRRHRR